MLLAHPEPETLGRFVEGTLDDPERAAIVQHVADCDDCRILVVDSAEFIEPAKTESNKWWMGIAATFVIVVGGVWFWNDSRNPLGPVIETSSKLSKRPTEARLAEFSFVPLNRMRGSGEDTTDPAALDLDGEIANVLERRGDDPKTLHAKGVAHLLAAWRLTQQSEANTEEAREKVNEEVKKERAEAVANLQGAADRVPDNASYQTDLAAALLTTGGKANHDLALEHLKKALAIDPRNQEALFNQALALQSSNPKAAIAAFKTYLNVDPSSKWAEEARRDLELLEETP